MLTDSEWFRLRNVEIDPLGNQLNIIITGLRLEEIRNIFGFRDGSNFIMSLRHRALKTIGNKRK